MTIFDRLRDGAGPVPGLAGFSIVHVPDATRCGGIATALVRANDARIAPTDHAFVTFLDMRFVAGLDFSEPTLCGATDDDHGRAISHVAKPRAENKNAAESAAFFVREGGLELG